MFDLTQNPFYVLGASLDAGVEDIYDLGQDAVFEGRADEASAAKAQQKLIPPRLRLVAEVGWFADVPTETATVLAQVVLEGDLSDAVNAAKNVAPLSRANAAAHLCGRFPQSQLSFSILIGAWNELDRSQLFQAIVEARVRAGLPRPNREHFDEALNELETIHARQASRSIALNHLPGAILTGMLQSAIGQQELGPMLSRVVREYDKASEARLEEIREKISAEIARCRASSEIAAEAVESLRQLLSRWNEIIQPVQLLEQVEGHEEARSRRLSRELRDLALWLANEERQHREALALTKALLNAFPKLDSLAAQLRKDVDTLAEIVQHLPELETKPVQPVIEPVIGKASQPTISTQARPNHAAHVWKPLPNYQSKGQEQLETYSSKNEDSKGWGAWIAASLAGAIFLVALLNDPAPHAATRTVTSSAWPVASSITPNPSKSAPPILTSSETLSPPAGNSTTLWLRYCTFQNSRLEHLRSMLSSTNQNEIDRFNALIRDFNNSCPGGSHGPAADTVQDEARRRDDKLRQEASAILESWRNAATPQTTVQPKSAPSTARLLNIKNGNNARMVQGRLQQLGYYKGPIDGGFGSQSVAALRAFKRDQSTLPTDDVWDLETQEVLMNQ